MIISHRGLLAASAGLSLILFGGQGVAADVQRRQATTPIAPPAPSSTGGSDGPVYFETEWPGLQGPYAFKTNFTVNYTVRSPSPAVVDKGNSVQTKWALLWTSATTGTPDGSNTYLLLLPGYTCDSNRDTENCSLADGARGSATLNLQLNTGLSNLPSSFGGVFPNFFICLANDIDTTKGTLTCESYSGFFSLGSRSENPLIQERQGSIPVSLQIPTGILSVSSNTAFILTSGASVATPAPTTPSSVLSSILTASGDAPTTMASTATITTPPTGTVYVTPTPTSSPGSKASAAGLATGAIIGIAIGGFFVLLLAILIGFFCFRRSRRIRNQNQTEQVLLTHNHNMSRDMMSSEKDGSEGPMLASVLETRSSSAGPFDHLSASAPYSGPAAPRSRASSSGHTATNSFSTTTGGFTFPPSNPHLAPQRHATSATSRTAQTDVSAISRGLSDASGPISPRTMNFEEPYHDVPIYGDARHVPQVYQGGVDMQGNLQAPFLSEPGMTDEELSRLEDEERRIDAAIAEAEAERERRR